MSAPQAFRDALKTALEDLAPVTDDPARYADEIADALAERFDLSEHDEAPLAVAVEDRWLAGYEEWRKGNSQVRDGDDFRDKLNYWRGRGVPVVLPSSFRAVKG